MELLNNGEVEGGDDTDLDALRDIIGCEEKLPLPWTVVMSVTFLAREPLSLLSEFGFLMFGCQEGEEIKIGS